MLRASPTPLAPEPGRSRVPRMRRLACSVLLAGNGLAASADPPLSLQPRAVSRARWYPRSVSRSVSHRVVAVIALLCQLATAAHVPTAHAHPAGKAPAPLEHCAHPAQPDVAPAAEHSTRSTDHAGHARHPGSCCGGLCPCACAPAAASAVTSPEAPYTAHLPVTLLYRVPVMLQLDTVFFRPPI